MRSLSFFTLLASIIAATVTAAPLDISSILNRNVDPETSAAAHTHAWKRGEDISPPEWKREEDISAPGWKRGQDISAPGWKRGGEITTPGWERGEDISAPEWKREEVITAPDHE